MSEKPQKRVLVLADFACATGFAQVAQNVVAQLLKETAVEYQIDVIGINYYGLPNEWQNLYPQVRLFPAQLISNGDLFGRFAFLNMLATGVYDLAWSVQDTFNIEEIGEKLVSLKQEMIAAGKQPFTFSFYFPIDAAPKENWITKSVSIADLPVAYTQYAYDEAVKLDPSLESKLKIIPHGVDTKIFKPVDLALAQKFRQEYFVGRADGKFLITNVNRNQPRKDIARTMQIFRLFKNQVPNALLYLHMKMNDVAYNLDEVARNFELVPDEDYILPKHFDEHDGLPLAMLNLIYNASDVVMTTSLGEGWGLSMTEAMAAKTPVIAPNHTALRELLADGRGTLVTAGKGQNDWVVLQLDNERLRPIVSVAEYVEKLVYLAHHQQEARAMAETAYEYVTTHWTWDIVGQAWRELFQTTFPTPAKITPPTRNAACPCGSGKKYKKCHGGAYGGQ